MQFITVLYGVFCYTLGVLSLAAFILFANNYMGVLGVEGLVIFNENIAARHAIVHPLVDNLLLLAFFAVQHSVMARQSFKDTLCKYIPVSWERSTYVLATAVVTFALIAYWQPMQGSLWHVENEMARMGIAGIYFFSWAITFSATFMLNHFHLFGLQQTFKSHDPDSGAKVFKTPLLYSLVRHPIQTGIFIAVLATPEMSLSHALLAFGMIGYIFIGLHYEERDLVAHFGDTYRDYKKSVPKLLPFMWK